MRIFDVHTHPVFFDNGARHEDVSELVNYAKSIGIVKMVALGDVLKFGPTPDKDQINEINETTLQLMRWEPDFFVGFCYLNPTLGEKPLRKELELRLGQNFRGIKLEIANNADSPVMDPLMKAAVERAVPILQHTWRTAGKRMRKTHSDPIDTCRLAARYPEATVIMAHLYSYGVRGVIEAKHLPNVLVDTSSCLPFAGILERAVDILGDRRILYGSDHPIREFGQCVGRVTGSNIPLVSINRILFQNAAKLFELPSN